MTRRYIDPYKNKSNMTADAVMIRSKAERIHTLLNEVLSEGEIRDTQADVLLRAAIKCEEIIDIVEGVR